MTRVLLVYHDVNVADVEADELRRAGYEVDRCAGPRDCHTCPVLDGRPCWQVEKADVLVYDSWASGDGEGARTLIERIRETHPDTPVVLTSPGPALGWEETSGVHGVTILEGQPTGVRLDEAIRAALATPIPAL